MGDLEPLFGPAADVDLTTLLARLSAARAGYLDNLDNANLATIPDISTLSAARIGYLDNIDNANLATIDDISSLTATEIAHLDADISEVVQQVALTGHPANSIGKILYDFYITRLTAARCGYLANINNANLATIADISSLTATEIGYLANINNANLATIADISSLTATEIARLDADISSRAPASEYDTEMARITANVATEAKQDVIDGFHDVPGEDSATDTQIRDVVGKKSDTVAGTSIVSISKQVKAKTDNIPASPAPANEYDTQLDANMSTRAPANEYDTQLDANMSTRAPANEYDTEMARITADVATEAKQDVIDGFHDVPGEDSATDAQIRDVVGKKSDTVAGTSIVSIAKQVKAKTDNIPASPAPASEYDTEMARITANVATEAKQDVIDGYHDVPGEDSATDAQIRDVVGKKTDTVAGTSIVAISKQVKAKTDNIPASPAPSGEYDTELDANMSTRAPASEYDTEMARITANVATEAKQDTIDGIVDDIKAKTELLPAANTDEQGSPVWVTLTHTTSEFDISSLFTTPLTGTTRRKYSIFLDLTGPAGDAAAWTECTVKVKVEIDGTNPRTVDKKVIAKTDVAAGEEPGVNIDMPAVAKDVQVTLQFDVALGADQTIYYSVVTEALE